MRGLVLFSVLTVSSATVGVAQNRSTSGTVRQGAAERVSDRAPAARAQSRLEREVRHELVMLPYFGVFDDISFQVSGSTVTLSGAVTRPTLKSSAENVVKDIEGVESVVNRIEVLPLSPSDDRIRLAAYRAIYGHTALNRYAMNVIAPIRIIVKNGHLTLTGVVASEMDKNIATTQANSVSGVFSVKSELRVEKTG